jgi:hypothetical protein
MRIATVGLDIARSVFQVHGVEAVSSAAKPKHWKYDREGPYACLVWSRPRVLPWTAVDGGARKASNLSFTIE